MTTKKYMSPESFDQMKEYIEAKVPYKSIIKLMGTSDMTIRRVNESKDFLEYQAKTKEYNAKALARKKELKAAKMAESAPVVELSEDAPVDEEMRAEMAPNNCDCCDNCQVTKTDSNTEVLNKIERHLGSIAMSMNSGVTAGGMFSSLFGRKKHSSNSVNR